MVHVGLYVLVFAMVGSGVATSVLSGLPDVVLAISPVEVSAWTVHAQYLPWCMAGLPRQHHPGLFHLINGAAPDTFVQLGHIRAHGGAAPVHGSRLPDPWLHQLC